MIRVTFLKGEPWSIRWEPGQGYIKGIPVNPQHSIAQDPSLCFSLSDRCQSHCFMEPAFQRENPILLATSVTSAPPPCPPLSFNPVSPPSRNALESLFLILPPSFLSGPWCPRQSGGSVCFAWPRSIHPIWWNRIQWPPLCPVVSIPGSCLVSVRDREPVRGGVTWWLVRRQAENMSWSGTTERWYWSWVNGPAGMFCSEFMLTPHFGPDSQSHLLFCHWLTQTKQ